jgi:hypothetical protein
VQCDLFAAKQGDILQQQSNHPFAFVTGRALITQQPGKVGAS